MVLPPQNRVSHCIVQRDSLSKKFKAAENANDKIHRMLKPSTSTSFDVNPSFDSSSPPSQTAWLCAIARARHQILDRGEIFPDPLAVQILGPQMQNELLRAGTQSLSKDDSGVGGGYAKAMRGALVIRSRIAEDTIHQEVAAGATQCVVLGAGLDTFALRNQWPKGLTKVFEVDQPATQAWKRQLAHQAGLDMPAGGFYVPVDFERENFMDQLKKCGFDPLQRTVFTWLGVTMYLTPCAIEATIAQIGDQLTAEGTLVFDFVRKPSRMQWGAKLALHWMARRYGRMGEPWKAYFTDDELRKLLQRHRFGAVEWMSPSSLRDTFLPQRPTTPWQRSLSDVLGGIVRCRIHS